mmetsp:Transcript_15642/g.39971  ORF Transcript_15642/g.39971 Transcript_15642/m.39971 type:complete len:225 (-) Transcript_15642:2591-3265(-)
MPQRVHHQLIALVDCLKILRIGVFFHQIENGHTETWILFLANESNQFHKDINILKKRSDPKQCVRSCNSDTQIVARLKKVLEETYIWKKKPIPLKGGQCKQTCTRHFIMIGRKRDFEFEKILKQLDNLAEGLSQIRGHNVGDCPHNIAHKATIRIRVSGVVIVIQQLQQKVNQFKRSCILLVTHLSDGQRDLTLHKVLCDITKVIRCRSRHLIESILVKGKNAL